MVRCAHRSPLRRCAGPCCWAEGWSPAWTPHQPRRSCIQAASRLSAPRCSTHHPAVAPRLDASNWIAGAALPPCCAPAPACAAASSRVGAPRKVPHPGASPSGTAASAVTSALRDPLSWRCTAAAAAAGRVLLAGGGAAGVAPPRPRDGWHVMGNAGGSCCPPSPFLAVALRCALPFRSLRE